MTLHSAGIYAQWTNTITGETKTLMLLLPKLTQSCQKYTTSKKRMPVILKKPATKWLQHHPIAEFALPSHEVNLVVENLIKNSLLISHINRQPKGPFLYFIQN
jgi:hypothetical protein